MAKIGENLRTFVLAIPGLGAYSVVMAQNSVPQREDMPYVYYGRTTEVEPICIDGGKTNNINSRFDIEVCSPDIDESIDIADIIRAALNGHRGAFGDQQVRGIQVEDKSDNYQPKTYTEEGIHITSLDVNIIQ